MPRFYLAIAALGLVGCVDDGSDSAVVILQNQIPEAGCVIPGSPTDTYSSSGRIDVNSPSGYILTPVATNTATTVEGNETARIAFVQGARIDLSSPDPDVNATLQESPDSRIEVPFAGRIDPAGGTSGFGFTAISRELVQSLSDGDFVFIDVKLFGSLGGSGFESAPWRFPVEVCDGCTVNNLGECSSLSSSFTPTNTGNSCNPYQDRTVDCCTSSGSLVCPAVGTGTAAQ
jgi:hypothetical protein